MPPLLALALTICLVVYLFRQDKREFSGVSGALWLPLIWMLITATRLPSNWLSLQGSGSAAQVYQEGNVFDRIFYLVVILASIYILRKRKLDWSHLLRSNPALTAFLIYCLVSMFWSDYPFVAFKRWYRDLGVYFTVLVVLTETKPFEAICLLFRRFAYVGLPLSVTLIKYFPEWGMQYSQWTGEKMYTGIAGNKNMLGSLCLMSGLYLVWDTLRRRKQDGDKMMARVNWGLLAVLCWLFNRADSKTSLICFLLGTALLLICEIKAIQGSPKRIVALVLLIVTIFVPLNYVFDINAIVYRAAGRDATLTGRTELWEDIRQMNVHPLIGTGYENFWLGDRLAWLWSRHDWGPNQAHNGYLEVYINLGLIGLTLLLLFLLATLIRVRASLVVDFRLGIFALAVLTSIVLYNFTEAAFKYHVNWYAFVVVAMAVSRESMIAFRKPQDVTSTKRSRRIGGDESDPMPANAYLLRTGPYSYHLGKRQSQMQQPRLHRLGSRFKISPADSSSAHLN